VYEFPYGGKSALSSAKQQNYTIVSSAEELRAVQKTPVLGLFAENRMKFAIDRHDSDVEPSLKEMTEKAIDLLKGSDKGFFLFVEGSLIDIAGHNNDAATQVSWMCLFMFALIFILKRFGSRKNTTTRFVR
jgi:alkaline phosphatase